jgi:anti-sigma B factor antagonist
VTVLRIEFQKARDSVTISLLGELDLSGESELEGAFSRAETDGCRVIVVDLSGLNFIDSTGLRVILAAAARARTDGRRLLLVPGPEHVHRVFRISLLDKRLEFVGDPSTLER